MARAPGDGYNLLVHSAAFTTAAALHSKLSFDPVKDLLPVARLGVGANILAVHADSPARTLQELLALARSQPGRLHYGSGGPGSSSHLTTEVLLGVAKVDIVHVPFKGLGPAVTALLGGQVQMLLVGMPNVMPQIRAGRLRALAVSTPQRSPFVPDVPTIAEAGVPGYSASKWWGLWSPGGTPRAIVQRLNDEGRAHPAGRGPARAAGLGGRRTAGGNARSLCPAGARGHRVLAQGRARGRFQGGVNPRAPFISGADDPAFPTACARAAGW